MRKFPGTDGEVVVQRHGGRMSLDVRDPELDKSFRDQVQSQRTVRCSVPRTKPAHWINDVALFEGDGRDRAVA
jgi:hypothetical protein